MSYEHNYHKLYYQKNKERIKEYKLKNKEKLKQSYKKYREENKEKIKEYKKKYRQNNRNKIREYNKQYSKKHYEKNKALYVERARIWSKNHKEYMRGHRKKQKAKRQRNLGFNKLHENPFQEPTDWHHVDDFNVVALPRDLHRLHLGKYHREKLVPIVEQIYGRLK